MMKTKDFMLMTVAKPKRTAKGMTLLVLLYQNRFGQESVVAQ